MSLCQDTFRPVVDDAMGREVWTCQRKAGHKGKHREGFSGHDGISRFTARMEWRRR